MTASYLADPGQLSRTAEAVAGRLDVDGFDADAPVVLDPGALTARTVIRDPEGHLFELTLRAITGKEGCEFAAAEGWLR
jgi:hypothetical protein